MEKMMKNNKQGVADIMIFLLVTVLVAGILLFYLMTSGKFFGYKGLPVNDQDSMMMSDDSGVVEPAEPVSESNDLDVIEAELEATITGSPETEIDAMAEDASEL